MVRHFHSPKGKPHVWGFPDPDDPWRDSVSKLQEYEGLVLRVVTADSSRLYSGAFLWESAHAALVYRKELWAAPCRVARSLRPFAVAHVRAGDGKFLERAREKVLVHGFGKQVAELRHKLDARNDTGVGAIVFVADVNSDKLWHGILKHDPWKALVSDVKTKASAVGRSVKFINTIVYGAGSPTQSHTGASQNTTTLDAGVFEENGAIEAAVSELATALGHMANWRETPKEAPLLTLSQLLFDVMLASLADVFAGNPDSSLSGHIEVNRRLVALSNPGDPFEDFCS